MECENKVKKLFLPKGTSLMSIISPEGSVPEELASFVRDGVKIKQNRKGVFFEVILNDDLFLILKEGKISDLENCSCRIPVLQDLVADSVNKAHGELLKRFSPSGTTNRSVFETVHYKANDEHWEPLRVLRSQADPELDGLKRARLLLKKLGEEGKLSAFTQLIDWVVDVPDIHLVADTLSEIKTEHLQKISTLIGISSVRKAISFWQENKENSDEEFWQAFLKDNSYVLSQTFLFPVIILEDKAFVGGKGIGNKGGNILDFLFTHRLSNNVALIEIKTPATSLLGSEYRTGVYGVSQDLSGSISQVLNYKDSLSKEYASLVMNSPHDFHAFDPKCVVIAGCISSLRGRERLRSFELFRSNLKDVQIVTYDELFNKLEMLLHLLEGSANL